MIATAVVNKLLEADDDVQRYVSGVVPPNATLYDGDEALHSRGFRFREYDGTPPVLVNRWIYQQGEEFWVISPLEKANPENKLFNIQCWRGGNLIHNYTENMQKVVAFFDRLRRG